MSRYKIETEHGDTLFVEAEDSDRAVAEAENEAVQSCILGGQAKLYLLGDEALLLGEFELSGYSLPKKWKDVKELLSKIRQEALDKAKTETTFKAHRSRGVMLSASNSKGCSLITTADDWEFPKALNVFRNNLDWILKNHPDVDEVWAECGVDSAQNLRDLIELIDYYPWTGEASVLIWKKGWEGIS